MKKIILVLYTMLICIPVNAEGLAIDFAVIGAIGKGIGKGSSYMGRSLKNKHSFYLVEVKKQNVDTCKDFYRNVFFEPDVKFWGKLVINKKEGTIECTCLGEECCPVLEKRLKHLQEARSAEKKISKDKVYKEAKNGFLASSDGYQFRIINKSVGKKYLINEWKEEQTKNELIKAIKPFKGASYLKKTDTETLTLVNQKDSYVYLNKKGKCKKI